jgi:ketosteroid isomerase-like protein
MKNVRLKYLIVPVTMMMLLVAACNKNKPVPGSKVLSDTDRFYSSLSAEKGMNASFLEMFDSAGVMLRANHMPIAGYDSIKALLLSESDSSFTLTWEPLYTKIAASGELGYTYGTYQITDKATDSVIGVGKYTTIWEKKSDGKWKALLDTGNPGLGKTN